MQAASATESTRMVAGVAALAANYDGFLLDQWGVLHDGVRALSGALDCLAALRAAGKKIVILSNSGRTGDENAVLMQRFGIEPELYDALITAGDDAREAFRSRPDAFYRALGRRCVVVARPADVALVDDFGLESVDNIDAADFVFVLSLDSPRRGVPDYESMLQEARARGLPMVCANPDLTRVTPDAILEAPGAVAKRYEALGGTVRYHGKPDPGIYQSCLATFERLGLYRREQVIAVGDSIAHDVAGADSAGLASA
ncbi:MAG: TIGR01459 family HAD-type hydrolase, partial [Pseudomonadota bacterium]|nr:TIGR01459 family HAD-type hydrolase [Pseudomonadota bacterium]